MNAKVALQTFPRSGQPNRRAIVHLFDEYERARNERDVAEARLARFADTIQLLMDSFPPHERDELMRKFSELQGVAVVDSRAGAVHNNVVALFAKKKGSELSVLEVHSALEKDGSSVDQKAVYNSIAYLARTGKLMRVARGKYVLRSSGCGVEGEDYDYGNIRTTEHDW